MMEVRHRGVAMSKWIALAAIAAVTPFGPAWGSDGAPVQVMVLGTYHFDNPGLDLNNPKVDDVLTPKRQRELQKVADALASFKPTKIMVERVVDDPGLADPGYARFTAGDLARNRDERVQIAYRLAKQTGAPVFGIDEQPSKGEPDYFPFQAVADWAKANQAEQQLGKLMAVGAQVSKKLEEDQKTMTIAQLLLDRNRPETIVREQQMYYGALAFGDTVAQPGADLNAMWYLRNAKIFAKMEKVTKPGDRVVVIYGSGHNFWLRHFAEITPGHTLVETAPYLEKAAPK